MQRKVGFAIFKIVLAHGALVCPAVAQQTDFDDQSDFSQEMDDAQASFELAQRAAAAGDLRTAITALERVLLINPSLNNVKLELGLLYHQVGRSDVGAVYIREALKASDIPPDQRKRALAALGRTKSALSPHRLNGSVAIAGQYDSNPNASPDEISFFLPDSFLDAPIVTESATEEVESTSLAVNGTLEYGLRLPGQMGHEIVVDGQASSVTYSDVENLDVIAGSIRVGPSIKLGQANRPGHALRPFAVAGNVQVDGEEYYSFTGGGIDFTGRGGLSWRYNFQARIEDREYSNSPTRATAEDLSGEFSSVGIALAYSPTVTTSLSVNLGLERADADVDYNAYDRVRVGAAISQRFGGQGSRGFTITAQTAYSSSSYDAVDPLVSNTEARDSDSYRIGISVIKPVTRNVAILASVDQSTNSSNLPNFEYDNLNARLGLRAVF